MAISLTPRMKNWLEAFGVHLACANVNGKPVVVVSYSCQVEDDTISVPLEEQTQLQQIGKIVTANPQVAIAPGQLGSVRAPYQFKGKASLEGNNLKVKVEEIYCTKPGYEAGLRMDTMGFENMKEFEETRWKDIEPPKA